MVPNRTVVEVFILLTSHSPWEETNGNFFQTLHDYFWDTVNLENGMLSKTKVICVSSMCKLHIVSLLL